ncbi:MAG: hypothetical protein KAT34_02945 [Candidatus Aminicenantes bacterium]|nr:hypothetical protein [Candidatus Aminicenantes bacterium]
MDTKLIILEGLTGSGKSTTAQFISSQLQKQDIKCRCILEGESGHPLYINMPGYSITEAAKVLHSQWKSFVRQVKQFAVPVITEGCLFQYIIGSMLKMDIDKEEIMAYLHSLKDLFKVLNPILIYLRETDVEKALQKICAKRGEFWKSTTIHTNNRTLFARRRGLRGFSGYVKFKQVLEELSNRLFEEFDIRKIVIDKSKGDWQSYYKQIFVFMSLPLSEDQPLTKNFLEKFTGTYTCSYEGAISEFYVKLENGSLVIYDNPYLAWIPSPLIWKEKNIFRIKSRKNELTFEEDSDGLIKRIRMRGPVVGHSKGDAVFPGKSVESQYYSKS